MRSRNVAKNKMIAEYMGGVYESIPLLGNGYRFSGEDMRHHIYGSGIEFINEKSLAYDSNWNHLVPVIAKIRLTEKRPNHQTGRILYENLMQGYAEIFDIGLIYIELCAYIEWKNNKQ